jgi:glycerate 2-kinase
VILPQFAQQREHLAHLRAVALRAVDPAAAVRRSLSAADFAGVRRVFIVGAGKAGVAMARAAAELAGERLAVGVMAVPRLPEQPIPKIEFVAGGHPLPTEGSLNAGRAIAQLLAQTTEEDLVLALISGGGSALLELPSGGLSLDDLQITNYHLLLCGGAIHDINAVRGALSQIKRGGLARLAQPARVLGLILSDVIGNPLDVIASGPTSTDRTKNRATDETESQAWAVIVKYQLQDSLPPTVVEALRAPSVPSSVLYDASVDNRLIASNRLAGEAAAEAAQALGYEAAYLSDDWQGEAREVGTRFAEMMISERPGRGARCIVVGGESTVTVRGAGKGGRNQEAALAAALVIEGKPNIVIATFATDGVDGPTDAAGAVVTGDTVARARALSLDPQIYLDNNDAYTFFAALGDLLLTGPTGTNVNDLMFGLVYA